MTIRESTRIGIEGLRTHRIRSVLTALGIIFGVAAVVAMLSIGEGAKLEALEQIRLMGMNNILIRATGGTSASAVNASASFSPGLVWLDAEAIAEICPGVDQAVPQWEDSAQAQYKDDRTDVKVVGTTPEFLEVFGYGLGAGRFLERGDLERQENVCVLGTDVKNSLFPFGNPIGKSIKLASQWFSVIGVMETQLAASTKLETAYLRNLNEDVYIPLSTAQSKMQRSKPRLLLDQITVKTSGEQNMDQVTDVVRRILARRHFGVDDYEVIVPEALVKQSQKTQQIFNIVMGAIAGISLLVGGIGIMNIMLASVLERTKEIGLRRAVGARRSDVLSQFLIEATILSVVGGVVGILLGYALTQAITTYAGWRTVVSIEAIVLAFSVSAAVGISFGYYPARKAACQNPIESLHYE